jgi:hypothetical protein
MFSRKHLAVLAASAGLVVAGAAAADAGDKAQGRGCDGPQASRGEGRHGGEAHGMERMRDRHARMGEMHARMGAMHGRHGAAAPADKPTEEEHKH